MVRTRRRAGAFQLLSEDGLTPRDVILAGALRVDEHTTTIDGVPVFYRTASEPGTPAGAPIVYLHDAITSSDDLVPFLERTGGVAPDLIGFGRSGKGGHLDYSPEGLGEFLERFLSHLGIESARLAGHGWGGALGLLLALRRPEIVERLVLINAVALLDGFTWHRPARLWRRPMAGELIMGSVPRRLFANRLRTGSTLPGAWTAERLAAVWEQFDHGTQRAVLRLHRGADEARLAELGQRLGDITAPTLIVWGDADPWFAPGLADVYGARLPGASVEHIAGAGHWPWLDEPRVLELVAEFLTRR